MIIYNHELLTSIILTDILSLMEVQLKYSLLDERSVIDIFWCHMAAYTVFYHARIQKILPEGGQL